MNVFDIIGPVMIGPSSSHTAGAARIGGVARALLGAQPVRADIGLHGSFARTGRGHGTDKAIVAGLLGFAPDDTRLRNALDIAAEQGMQVEIHPVEIDGAHPNTALLHLETAGGRTLEVQGSSVGGGSIRITSIDGMEVQLTGERPTLIVVHQDMPGIIAAVTETVAGWQLNIGSFRLTRQSRGGTAVMALEMDGAVGQEVAAAVSALPHVMHVTLLQPV
ncbi:L-serine ammonia-lyase, iron-sulfur-dependent subunit beta [uncultured Gemmiger sp.]|uniref:L-serine ammonia-lyase, iron-sulfur-dependent subunit beta n=1 Tax=uncultured Gemmiger sp. TaxID=1623490 RepID=UPI0025FE679C|nr:L-serine ammonia-lyase, iron-sulfur-dependent subunit beta [uncultured Gemmiger sp.]